MTDAADEALPDDEAEAASGAPDPYVYDPADVAIAAAISDSVFVDLDPEWTMVQRVIEEAKARGLTGTPLELELIHAAGHGLHREVGGKPGCALGRPELHELLRWPRPIAETPPDVAQLWRDIANSVAKPAAVARYEDLLFCLRDGNGRDRVRRATGGYLTAIDASAEIDMDQVEAILRVWSLARSVRDLDIDDEVRARMAAVAADVMATTPGGRAGVALPMLSALAAGPLRNAPDPHDVDGMLAQAATLYVADFNATQIAVYRRSRAQGDQPTLDLIARDEVNAYFADAEAAEPAVRMIRLNNAARVATQRGLPDLARKATALMQQIKPSELGLKRIRVETSIPSYVPESFLAGFTSGASWRDGLAYFLDSDVPSGSIDQVRNIGKSSRGVLARLFPTTLFGAGGLPRVSTQGEADEDSHDLSRAASISAQNVGLWLAEGLTRMESLYELPDAEELTSALVSLGCRDPQLATGLAKGIRFFWDGDFETSIAVTMPKFEAAARALLRELDEGIYRVQVGKDPGGYVGLYVLLDELERIALDPSWAYFFRWLLLGPYGANLRNEVAHGFVFDPGPVFAALTLRAVGLLALVAGPLPDDRFGDDPEPQGEPSRPRSDVVAALKDPLGPRSAPDRAAAAVANALERVAWWLRTRRLRRIGTAGGNSPSSDEPA